LIHQKEPSFEIKWKGKREHTIEPRSTFIEDVPKMIKAFEREHNVEWRNGRCYYDEKRRKKRREKIAEEKRKQIQKEKNQHLHPLSHQNHLNPRQVKS